jgi:hypothetical protein
MQGEAACPLEELTVVAPGGNTVAVRDGAGREYFASPAGVRVTFLVGGVLGLHHVELRDRAGKAVQTLSFPVRAETRIDDEGGQFSELLDILLVTMLRFGEGQVVRWNGRIYRFFVCWLRDHVHTMKGMKYFHGELKSAIDLYRDSQREDGMIWDNVYPRTAEPNGWDDRFNYGGFIRPFEDYTAEFKRIPVENDVEYLFVEGLYYTWKATGDDAWMVAALDAAVRAMEYSVTSPYRWSAKYGLLKRGFTIDTWDFQNDEDSRISACGDAKSLAFGDAMAVRVGATRFGVMFGDNTGYIAACGYLAEMLDHAGRGEQAKGYRTRAVEMKRRLDTLAWNGRHYVHHVPEDAAVYRDLGVDLDKQVSLSNAYSLNRGLTQEQCAAIIRTYREIRADLPDGSPGEWYTIYPPFERGYGGHNAKWQYMNGGVTPIVAGELAHGAFEHGAEDYGADILRRLLDLARRHGGHMHCAYTGALPPPPHREFTPLDLSAIANTGFTGTGEGAAGWQAVPGWTGEGENDLHEMPTGPQTLADVKFLVADPAANGGRGCLGLSQRVGYAPRAEIPIPAGAAAAAGGVGVGSVYFLHTVSRVGASGLAGTVSLHYADGTHHTQEVGQGRHVCSWWYPQAPDPHVTAVAWHGQNKLASSVGVLAWGLDNPFPGKTLTRIVLEGPPSAGGLWLVLGVTLCTAPAYFPPSPVSFGIPDNWGAAAVVYALIEGLAGVKDLGTALEEALLAPRWAAGRVDAASATVTYPASGGYVAYRYRHDPPGKALKLTVTASGHACRCHVLLPAGRQGVRSVLTDGQAVPFSVSAVEQSFYADFELEASSPRQVTIVYD